MKWKQWSRSLDGAAAAASPRNVLEMQNPWPCPDQWLRSSVSGVQQSVPASPPGDYDVGRSLRITEPQKYLWISWNPNLALRISGVEECEIKHFSLWSPGPRVTQTWCCHPSCFLLCLTTLLLNCSLWTNSIHLIWRPARNPESQVPL